MGNLDNFFLGFLDLELNIFFLEIGFRGSFWTVVCCHVHVHIVSQFLDRSSNLKASMMHLIPFMCHMFISVAAIFYVIFPVLSGNGRYCLLSTSGTNGTL